MVRFALVISACWCFVGIVEAVIAEEHITYADVVETLVFVACVSALFL